MVIQETSYIKQENKPILTKSDVEKILVQNTPISKSSIVGIWLTCIRVFQLKNHRHARYRPGECNLPPYEKDDHYLKFRFALVNGFDRIHLNFPPSSPSRQKDRKKLRT